MTPRNREQRLLAALDEATQKRFMRLLQAVRDWQAHMDLGAAERILRVLPQLPLELLAQVQPTLRRLYQAYRGDSRSRMVRAGAGWALPDYALAGLGNASVARFFAHQEGNGFIVSGRDLVSLSAAISTEATAAFNRKITPLLDDLSRRNEDAAWSYVHEVLGDDESETLVVEPRFRLFTDAEYRAGHSRNYRPSP